MPASRSRCLESALSREIAQAAGGGPGVRDAEGLEQLLHRPVLAALSVQRDEHDVGIDAREAARSGRARRPRRSASCPRRSSASSTRPPETSDTCRSSERPPLRTATRRRRSSRLAPRVAVVAAPRQREHVGEVGARLRLVGARAPAWRAPVSVP